MAEAAQGSISGPRPAPRFTKRVELDPFLHSNIAGISEDIP